MSADIIVDDRIIGFVRIDNQKIEGNGNYSYPQLIVPILFNLDKNKKNNEIFPEYKILNFSGDLSFSRYSTQTKISDFKSDYILKSSSNTYNLNIPLDQYRIKYLENKRSTDMPLTFRFNLIIGKMDSKTDNIKYFISSKIEIYIEIPKSYWIEKVLARMNHDKIKLIEISSNDKIIGSFDRIDNFINESKKNSVDGNYNNSVLNCRQALEVLSNIRNTGKPSFNEKIRYLIDEHLEIPENQKDKKKFINDMTKTVWNISNKSAHASNNDFNRFDAELILITSTAIIAYFLKYLN